MNRSRHWKKSASNFGNPRKNQTDWKRLRSENYAEHSKIQNSLKWPRISREIFDARGGLCVETELVSGIMQKLYSDPEIDGHIVKTPL